jgi:predicted nucleotidyltransferase
MTSMDKMQTFIDTLRAKYQPVAIILHGSRAVGKSRPHSDWDFYLLYEDKTSVSMSREMIAGEEVEWTAFQLPVTDERLLKDLDRTLQFGKVVWELDSAGTRLLEQARRIYARGFDIAPGERPRYKLQLVSKLLSMAESFEAPHIFLHYQFEFYHRALNWWFNLRGSYGMPYYAAAPRIQAEDPEYWALLRVVCGDVSKARKIEAGKLIIARLFPEPDEASTEPLAFEKEQQICQILREKYNPLAIVLHGSRALHKNRPHSNWDILLLFKDASAAAAEWEKIAGEDVELNRCSSEVMDENFKDSFGVMLQFARVLWEQDSIGTKVLEQAKKFYEKGVQISPPRRPIYKIYLTHKVHGMEDDLETPDLFLKHLHTFFTRAVDWWFLVRGQYGKPFYLAIPHIQAADPEHYALLLNICGDSPKTEKIKACYELAARLFP